MITTKQRSLLNGMAQKIQSTVYVGKNGIADSVLADANLQLEAKELVKATILKNSLLEAKDIANDLAAELRADVVSAMGNKIVLYRKSHKKGIKHIEI